jgi:transcriptional regulator with XRE-family HTH domain
MQKKHSFIPNNLRKHRKIIGLQQKAVARLLEHTTTTQLSRWEKGMAIPSAKNLLKLSIIYRCLPNELYFELYTTYKNELLEKIKKKHSPH